MIDYNEFLQFGEKLKTFTLAIATQVPAATSTVNSAISFFDVDDTQLYLFVIAGIVGENFTVNVQVTTTYGEIVNDTLAFTVVPA
jgi:hypothetical protein